MSKLVSGVTDAIGLTDSDREADAVRDASKLQAEYQREALDYLKEREAIPQALREEALTGLGGIYGLESGEGSQEELIDRALASPLYRAITGGRAEGEEAILRNAAMTGGLRSGNVQDALYDYNVDLENRALLEAYNQQLQGLSGLANLPSMAREIAAGTSGIGQTLAQGQIGTAQTRAAAENQIFEDVIGVGKIVAGGF